MLEKHGWKNNPFDPNLPDPNFLVYKKQTEEIIRRIKENSIIWINAPMGAGKTTILEYITENAYRYGLKALYWHYGINPDLEGFKQGVETYFKTGFFERFRPKKRVILIDEANYINDKGIFRYLVGLLDNRNIHPSIVFAAVTPPPSSIMFETFKDRRLNTVKIVSVDEEDYLNLVEKRIKSVGGKGLTAPFDEKTVRNIIRESSTPRGMLEKLLNLAYGEKMSGEIKNLAKIPAEAAVEKKEKIPKMIKPEDLSMLSDQQKRIVEIIETGPKTLNEIISVIGGKKGSVRVQLYNLSSIDFVKRKGYRMPFVERTGNKWRIHKEYEVVEPSLLRNQPVVKMVKKPAARAVMEEAGVPIPKKKEKMPGEEIAEQILCEHKAFDGKTAVDESIIIEGLCRELKCDKKDAEEVFIQLYEQGKVVYLKATGKVFNLHGK